MITSPKPTGKELWKAFVDAIWALLMPVIILGGIYGGYFTPTEAAAVAVVYGLIIGLFVYRELKWKDITVDLTACDFFYINGGCNGFSCDG